MLAALLLLPIACLEGEGEDEAEDVVTAELPAGVPPVRSFTGFGSLGGEWLFQLDTTLETIAARKGTEKPVYRTYMVEEQGAYKRFLKVIDKAGESFGWEMENSFLLHAFAVGADFPELYAAFSDAARTTPAAPEIAGDYLFIDFSPVPVNGSDQVKLWGILRIGSDETWQTWRFATGKGSEPTVAAKLPDEFVQPFPPAGGADNSGTWKQSAAAPWSWTFTDLAGSSTAYALQDEEATLLLVDLKEGFRFAIRAPAQTLDDEALAGNYHATLGLWNDGSRWRGRWQLPAGEEPLLGLWEAPVPSGQTDLSARSRCGSFPNLFKALVKVDYTGGSDDHRLYWIAAGNRYSAQLLVSAAGDFLGYGIGIEQQ